MNESATLQPSVTDVCAAAKLASRELGAAPAEVRNKALKKVASLLRERTDAILEANAEDLGGERAAGLTSALRDRLILNADRIEAMAEGVEAVISIDDPVGEEIEHRTLASGLDLRKVRVPLGVVAVVYEARPNVTIDCAALCIKSGNAVVLRGSSYAHHSNTALAKIVREGIEHAGLPTGAVQILDGGREELAELATRKDSIDLIIPRGGDGLKRALEAVATVPVMYAASGNCHVYVHADADVDMARKIVLNAKTSRPGVCNAAETLLVNAEIAADFLPATLRELDAAGVEIRGDARVAALAPEGIDVVAATGEDWGTEYHDLILAVGVVDSLGEAIDHIGKYGSGHSEAIVTGSPAKAGAAFTTAVDAASLYINASTRFSDGFEFGMGAEIGNSTQKLHARGPIGLRELTTTKSVLTGDGQTRG